MTSLDHAIQSSLELVENSRTRGTAEVYAKLRCGLSLSTDVVTNVMEGRQLIGGGSGTSAHVPF